MTTVVLCQPPQPAMPREEELLARIRNRASVRLIPHLYDVAETSPLWQELKSLAGPVVVFTHLYPQAAQWILARHELWPAQFQVVTYPQMPAEGEWDQLLARIGLGPTDSQTEKKTEIQDWRKPTATRWYPVINRDSCTNCLQCLQFCLFGVYEQGPAGELLVAHPDQCKPGCPACARVCPTGAILFPMYARDPRIAGAVGIEEPAEPAPAPAVPATFEDLDQLVEQMEHVMQRRR